MNTDLTNKTVVMPQVVVQSELLDFLQTLDKDFDPPLSSRKELAAYAAKLIARSEIVTARMGCELVGVAAVYCNDQATRQAYVPIVCVERHDRRRMLGARLVREVIRLSQERGMHSVELRTDAHRPDLIRYYQRLGFQVIDSFERFGGYVGVRMILKLPLNSGS